MPPPSTPTNNGSLTDCSIIETLDVSATSSQFTVERLIAAVEMVNVPRQAFPRRPPSPPVADTPRLLDRWPKRGGAGETAPIDSAVSSDRCSCAVKRDVGAKSGQFGHVHKSAFEDSLADNRHPISDRHQSHPLRLKVGWKARIRLGRDVNSAQRAVSLDQKAPVRRLYGTAPAASSDWQIADKCSNLAPISSSSPAVIAAAIA